MERSTTITLGVIGSMTILAVIAVAAIAGYMYYDYRSKNEVAHQNGVEFGKTTDQRACVDESVRQFGAFKEDSFLIRIEQFHIGHFTNGCLSTGKPTPKFCDGVPNPKSTLIRLTWSTQQCRDAGLRDGGPCNDIFEEVAIFCSTKKQETVSHPE